MPQKFHDANAYEKITWILTQFIENPLWRVQGMGLSIITEHFNCNPSTSRKMALKIADLMPGYFKYEIYKNRGILRSNERWNQFFTGKTTKASAKEKKGLSSKRSSKKIQR